MGWHLIVFYFYLKEKFRSDTTAEQTTESLCLKVYVAAFPFFRWLCFPSKITCFPSGLRSCRSPSRSISGYLLSGSLLPNSGPQVPLDTVGVNTLASEICVWRRKSGKRAVMQAKRVSEDKDICVKSCTQGRGGFAAGPGGAASGSRRGKERLSRPEHRPGGHGKGAAGGQGAGRGPQGGPSLGHSEGTGPCKCCS